MRGMDLFRDGYCLGRISVFILFFIGVFHPCCGVRGRGRIHASKGCEFPERWTGTWFQKGVHPPIKIQKDIFSFKGKCLAADSHMFYIEDTKEKCFRCVVIYEKHPNVLQYREKTKQHVGDLQQFADPLGITIPIGVLTECSPSILTPCFFSGRTLKPTLCSSGVFFWKPKTDGRTRNGFYPLCGAYCDGYRSLTQACSILNADAPLYSLFRVDADPVSCELRGPFTFTYNRGHGECQYPLSTIDSCTDDSHLLFRFQACADVLGTESSVEELTCTAVWKEGSAHYLVGKISTRKSYKQSFTDENAYRCFVFDYLTDKGVIQMSQSADATCDGLVSPWEGSRTMRLTKSKHPTSGCQFPSWVTSNHKWHTLDGRTTYTFGSKNNSFKISPPYQDQDDTKFICIEHLSNTANSSTIVAYSTSGCKNGYICMKFFRRHNHIIEIQYGELARSTHEACYSVFSGTSTQDFVTLVGRSVPTSGCPQLVETNEIRVHVVKAASSSFRPDFCRDHAVKIAGCRSQNTLEFLISCASFTDVKSFHCHGSWEEDGRSFLVTGLRNTGYKYCFVYWNKDKTAHLSGVHDTCRRSLEQTFTENVTFNISSTGVCNSNLLSSHSVSSPSLSTVTISLLLLVFISCRPIR